MFRWTVSPRWTGLTRYRLAWIWMRSPVSVSAVLFFSFFFFASTTQWGSSQSISYFCPLDRFSFVQLVVGWRLADDPFKRIAMVVADLTDKH
ncbi:unnamed protein product [Strongylus vulgaris]|uniref:Uncharacterized protein n=1 Tax=Strongylus vulgaris TaxID=40348 RepID=A0A3P7LND8_STRVU|nr:unnamed protein product [Strongylus vulgaris]